MEHNEYTLSHIIASLTWYARVASEIGHCTIKQEEINAYLNAFKELTDENERLENALVEQSTENVMLCGEVKHARADTVREMQEVLKSNIKGNREDIITDLKKYIDYHAKKMIGGDTK